ncbi:MAG: hypothetical protein RR840_10090, partial [Clostridium sp.]
IALLKFKLLVQKCASYSLSIDVLSAYDTSSLNSGKYYYSSSLHIVILTYDIISFSIILVKN